jgi:putative membrane protein
MKLPWILLSAYVLLFIVCAINPHDRAVWFAENAPIVLLVLAIGVVSRYHRFSAASLLFMSVLLFMHTIGGHYTFERVPFGWVTDLFDFSRNHYDRVAHFSVGFYAYPIAEVLHRRKLVNTNWILYLFPLTMIMAVAGSYEVFEWLYALSADPDAGIAVLGSQGDQWDAQKDIVADTLGAVVSLFVFWRIGTGSQATPPSGT